MLFIRVRFFRIERHSYEGVALITYDNVEGESHNISFYLCTSEEVPEDVMKGLREHTTESGLSSPKGMMR